MALYMPPIARKKRVPEKYNPDSFRVISVNAEEVHPKFPNNIIKPVYETDPRPARKILPDIPIRETRALPHTTYDFRAHNPHPVSCGFLRHNARLLNEPVCTVYTRTTHPQQHLWWPSRTNVDKLCLPAYTKDTIYRDDFQFNTREAPKGSTRHMSNPNTEPALGSVPVNFLHSKDAEKRVFQEGISFEHQYDSRADPNYPPRSKRHGAFVWDQMKPDKVKLLLDYHESVMKRKAAEEAMLKETCEQKSPTQSVRSAPVGAKTQDPSVTTTPVDVYMPLMDENPLLIDTHPPIAMAMKRYAEPAEPEPYPGPPSPPTWPYPQMFGSPSPSGPQANVNYGETTPDCRQSANPETSEVVVQDVGISAADD